MDNIQPPSKDKLQISNREVITALPVDTTEMPIRKVDWNRIYRKVGGIPKRTSFFVTMSGTCWGLGVSALLSLIPFYQATQSVEPWVKPLFWVVGLGACLLGWVSHRFSKEKDRYIQSSCDEVMRDMEEINGIYFPGEDMSKGKSQG